MTARRVTVLGGSGRWDQRQAQRRAQRQALGQGLPMLPALPVPHTSPPLPLIVSNIIFISTFVRPVKSRWFRCANACLTTAPVNTAGELPSADQLRALIKPEGTSLNTISEHLPKAAMRNPNFITLIRSISRWDKEAMKFFPRP